MDTVTLPRAEWAAVAQELDATGQGDSAPGLRARIAQLLGDTPVGWADESCTLDLDPPAAEAVRTIVRRRRGLPADPSDRRQRAASVQEAADVVSAHQAHAAVRTYRLEHRSETGVVVIGHTTAGDARQAELSAHAARLIAAGEMGELVLVDEATGAVVARRRLRTAPGAGEHPGGGTG